MATPDCVAVGFTGEGRCIEPAVDGSPYCQDHDKTQCRWFGGTYRPEENRKCRRPARVGAHDLVLCDVFHTA